MPAIFLAFNAACTAVAMLLLADLCAASSKPLLILSTVSLVVAPSVIEQHLCHLHGLCLRFPACWMTALASYLVLAKRGCPSFSGGRAGLACGMGGYQAWIGFCDGRHRYDADARLPAGRRCRIFSAARAKRRDKGCWARRCILPCCSLRFIAATSNFPTKGGLSGFGAGRLLSGWAEKILQAYRDFKDYFTSGPTIPARCCW